MSTHGEAGKGDTSRPFSVPYTEYMDRWDNTFKKTAWEKPTVNEMPRTQDTDTNEYSSEAERSDTER